MFFGRYLLFIFIARNFVIDTMNWVIVAIIYALAKWNENVSSAIVVLPSECESSSAFGPPGSM